MEPAIPSQHRSVGTILPLSDSKSRRDVRQANTKRTGGRASSTGLKKYSNDFQE